MEPGTELRAGHGTGAKALLARALSGALNVPAFADSDVGRIVSATAPVAVANGAYEFVSKSAVTGKQ